MMRLRVAELLRKRQMSARALAKTARIPTTTADRLAKGTMKRLDLRLIERLCVALRCEPGELFNSGGGKQVTDIQIPRLPRGRYE